MKRFLFLLIPIAIAIMGCSKSDNNNNTSSISLSVNEININTSRSEQQAVTIESNGSWVASVNPPTAASWLFVSPATGSSGTTTVMVSATENTTPLNRFAEIIFTMPDRTSASIEVRQPGNDIPFLTVENNLYRVNQAGENIDITVLHNIESYSITVIPESASNWITQINSVAVNNGDRLTFEIAPLNGAADREASIVFSVPDGSLTETVTIIQSNQNTYADRDYLQLQRATIGNGINIIIMGDGYTDSEINGEGKYEREMREAMNDLFSVYPYDAYRNYFNVWMVVGISNESGPSTGSITRDTRFGTRITGDGTEIVLDNENTVTEYAKSIPGIPQNENVLTVLLIINSPEYAGTCLIYSSGYSIAMCPRIISSSPNSDARAVIIHECGGHGFAKLADEYSYGGTIPASERSEIQQWQTSFRSFMNVDFTSNTSQILWSDFFNYDKYTTNFVQFPIGAYQGGLTFAAGVYRPEQNSCMNNNIDYYNAPSRYEIVRRIMAVSGINNNLTLDEFVALDNPRAPSYRAVVAARSKGVTPFGNPVLKY